jgi:putative transposase
MSEGLKAADGSLERKYCLASEGYDLNRLAERVAEIFSVKPEEIFQPGKQPIRVKARSLLCHRATRELGITMTEPAKKFKMTQPAISMSAQRGERIAAERGFELIDV